MSSSRPTLAYSAKSKKETPLVIPHLIEAEQAVLGAIICNNEAFDRVSDFLIPSHFYVAANQKVYDVICSLIRSGSEASHVTIKANLAPDVGADGMDSDRYVDHLMFQSTTLLSVADFAKVIFDMSKRRDLIALSEEMRQRAYTADIDDEPQTQIEEIEQKLTSLKGGYLNKKFDNIPLSIDQWFDRELPEPDRLMGAWMTTTSRIILNAPTGIGKTNFTMALGAHTSAGIDFLHWRSHRPARVLFIDGEMSRRLLLGRMREAVRRLGMQPNGFHVLSHEDIPGFQPLNTSEGRSMFEQIISRIGNLDFVILDNIMSLTKGDMKDEESWADVMPLIKSLTARNIGQLWVHHTGHDTSKGYGSKTKEWVVDTVVQGSENPRADTDVSLTLDFPKARERTPETRRDFKKVAVALVDDCWVHDAAPESKPTKVTPLGAKFLSALHGAFATGPTQTFQTWKAVTLDQWRAESVTMGPLINRNLTVQEPYSTSTNASLSRRTT